MNNKKIIIGVFVLLLILIIGGWAFFFLRNREPEPSEPSPKVSLPVVNSVPPSVSMTSSPSVIPLISSEPKKIELVTNHLVLAPVYSSKTISFFDKTDGLFKNVAQILDVFKEKKLSDLIFQDVFEVRWSPSGQQVIIGFLRDKIAKQWAVFDLQKNLSFSLPLSVQEPIWTFDGKKLLVHHYDSKKGESYFATLEIDGTKEVKLVDSPYFEPKMKWLSSDKFIFYSKPVQSSKMEKLLSYDLKKKQISTITILTSESYREGLFGFETLVSPTGKAAIFSVTNQNGSNLNLIIQNLESGQSQLLEFRTLVNKCAWSSDGEELYCAFSETLAGAQDLPFSYWRGAVQGSDSFVRFNLKTGEMRVLSQDSGYDAVMLVPSKEKDFLFFFDQKTQSLYRMKL